MIRVYKDKDIKVVTKGAFEQFYKPLGYNVVLDTIDVVKDVKENVDNNIAEGIKETVNRPRRSSSNRKK